MVTTRTGSKEEKAQKGAAENKKEGMGKKTGKQDREQKNKVVKRSVWSGTVEEQEKASEEEKKSWKEKGAEAGCTGLWHKKGIPVLPKSMMEKGVNNGPGEPRQPRYPGEEVVIDYTDMIDPVEGKRYLLVMVDVYSGWVEAIPTRKEDSKSVVKALINQWIPNHGFPERVRSDNGSHFASKELQIVEEAMGLKHNYGTVYHPQSQGGVERMNQTIKQKLAKCCAQTGLNWVEALPLVLVSVRANVNRSHGRLPYELHRGSPFPGPMRPMTLDALGDVCKKQYHAQLKALLSSFHPQGQIDDTCEEVWLKAIKRKWSAPRWLGPYRITARTNNAYQLEGRGKVWWHRSQCSPVKPDVVVGAADKQKNV
ncbi:uncharacterized protein LOC142996946 [Genypterus blacodes]|uniref:uncharacterized protein LOC142996946 n=1 Tax=Genypterus blacodes TaxID=154954 RepID=UPI003F775BB4